MAFADELNRRFRDLFSEPHPAIGMRPSKAIKIVNRKLLESDPQGRAVELSRIKEAATAYYEGRHRQDIPVSTQMKIDHLESEIARMNRVDWAVKKLKELGGPPTRHTIEESLRRSMQRKLDKTPPFDPDPPAKTKRQIEHAPGPKKDPAEPKHQPAQTPQKIRSHDLKKELVQEP